MSGQARWISPGPLGPVPGPCLGGFTEALGRGEITGDEAVQRLVEEVMTDGFLRSAPPRIVAEVREALGAMLETDPHLADLSRHLGARGAG